MSDTIISIDNSIGCVFRHNRLFNYLASPLHIDDGVVKCHVGRNAYRDIPMDYFKRDWHKDDSIDYNDLLEKISQHPDKSPFTVIYDSYYEQDDGLQHAYIHFDDDMEEKSYRFPLWKVTTCTKVVRSERINPYTMIMPVKDDMVSEIQSELDIINGIRKENEFIKVDDFQGFEFGLIKLLEKKYLRIV